MSILALKMIFNVHSWLWKQSYRQLSKVWNDHIGQVSLEKEVLNLSEIIGLEKKKKKKVVMFFSGTFAKVKNELII